MAKSKCEDCKPGLPGWLATYGDLVTLLLCFFVLMFAMSSTSPAKYQAAFSYFSENIEIMPGGESLTGGQLITDGVSQLSALEEIFTEELNFSEQKDTTETVSPTEVTTSEAALVAIENQILKEQVEYIVDQLSEKKMYEDISVDYNSQIIRLRISGELLFDSGKSGLKPGAENVINAVGEIISMEVFANRTIQIEGHTDNVPMSSVQFPSNWELSNARAAVVGKVLITNFSIDPSRVVAAGYGEYRPIESNDTSEGRAKNRRVEIKLISKDLTMSDSYIKLEE